MKKRAFSSHGGYAATLSEEDGQLYQGYHQDMKPIIRHVERMRDVQAAATRSSNKNGWHHMGTTTWPQIKHWCNMTGHTINQWSTNAGGKNMEPGEDPVSWAYRDKGVKAQFLRWFYSREHSKLHNAGVGSRKVESFNIPASIARDAVDLRGIEQ